MFLQLFCTIPKNNCNWFATCKKQEFTPSTYKKDEEDVTPGTLLLKLQIFISSQQCLANNVGSSKFYEQSLICQCFSCIGSKHFLESLFCTELNL